MGLRTFGYGGGREDIWQAEEDVYWAPERVWLDDQRYSGDRELANPLGAVQMGLIYVSAEAQGTVPDAHDPAQRHAPMMATTDIALIVDPAYKEIAQRFHQNPAEFADAFARAWYKLLHRDMGPVARYLGPWVPAEELLWQDPVPAATHPLIDAADIAALTSTILASGLSIAQLVSTAWASASTYRDTDKRGGANGARIRLSPQAEWDVNVVSGVARVVAALEDVQRTFNAAQTGGKAVSLADLIVLGGCVALQEAARRAGHDVTVPFTPGRADTTQDRTDVASFAVLEPTADGFRNYRQKGHDLAAEHLLIDKAFLLRLSAPEMTALVGGLRVLDANAASSPHGVLTDRLETLTNDFFREPARHRQGVDADVGRGRRVRGARPPHGRRALDRHPGRSRLRVELGTAGPGRGLRQRRRRGPVRASVRGGLGQGHEPGPLRPGVSAGDPPAPGVRAPGGRRCAVGGAARSR